MCHGDPLVGNVALRVAFAFDGVLADDSAEQVFQWGGIEAFQQSETEQANFLGGTDDDRDARMAVAEHHRLNLEGEWRKLLARHAIDEQEVLTSDGVASIQLVYVARERTR